jgi:5'-3' exonuclease
MRIAIVDSSLLLYNSALSSRQPHILKDFVDTLAEIVEKLNIQFVVLGNDIEKSRYRMSQMKEYKGHRKDIKKSAKQLKREETVRELRKNLDKLFGQYLCYGGVDGVEYDDIASLLGIDYRGQHEIIIISSDKDLLQIEGVKNFCPKKMAFIEPLHGLTRKQWTQYKMMVSDSSDGLSNIPNAGPVRSSKILQTYGNLPEALKHQDPDSQINKLLDFMRRDEGRKALQQSYKMVKLFNDFKHMNPKEIEQYESIKKRISDNVVNSYKAIPEVEDVWDQFGCYKCLWKLEMLLMQLQINRGE